MTPWVVKGSRGLFGAFLGAVWRRVGSIFGVGLPWTLWARLEVRRGLSWAILAPSWAE